MKANLKSAVWFRFCWCACLGGLVSAVPLLFLLWAGGAKPRYSWTARFLEICTVAFTVLCVVALRADLKARRES